MTKNPRDVIFHNHIFKIAVKILIFILAYRRRAGHDNEPVTLIFAVIRRVDMLERISSVPGTLIKSLAADGYVVIRRVDFENDRLFCARREVRASAHRSLSRASRAAAVHI